MFLIKNRIEQLAVTQRLWRRYRSKNPPAGVKKASISKQTKGISIYPLFLCKKNKKMLLL